MPDTHTRIRTRTHTTPFHACVRSDIRSNEKALNALTIDSFFLNHLGNLCVRLCRLQHHDIHLSSAFFCPPISAMWIKWAITCMFNRPCNKIRSSSIKWFSDTFFSSSSYLCKPLMSINNVWTSHCVTFDSLVSAGAEKAMVDRFAC